MKGFFDMFRQGKAEAIGPDGYPLMPDHPRREEHLAINAYLGQVITEEEPYRWKRDPKAHEAGRSLLSAAPEAKVRTVMALLDRMAFLSTQERPYYLLDVHLQVFSALLRSRLPFSEQDLLEIVRGLREQRDVPYLESTLRPIVTQIERHAARAGLSGDLQQGLDELNRKHLAKPEYADLRKLAQRIGIVLGRVQKAAIEAGEAWTDRMLADLAAMPGEGQAAWQALIEHAFAVKSSEASEKWLAEARRRLEAAGTGSFRERALGWFALAGKGTGAPMTEAKADLLKGLLWYCAASSDPEYGRVVCDVALAAFKKIPGVGPRSVKVGNACIQVLCRLPGLGSVAQLSRLQLKVKYSKVHALINAALEKAALREGMTRADLEEIAVPTFGLEGEGVLREDLGDYTAEVRVTGTDAACLTWVEKGGKPQKSVPAAVREGHAEELAVLKRTVKDIENMLPAQRDRIERLFLAERSWPFRVWRERYLDHPLLGGLSRRLIWHFEQQGRSALGIPRGEGLTDAQDRTLDWAGDGAVVRLWHPVGFDVSTVQAWRAWLETNGISQPFKQAHREQYLLTDAELGTRTYSNRFAAHILKQHQFTALCKQRGWKYQLQGGWDSCNTPTLELPPWDLRAEFWVESVPADDQMTEAGIYLYVSTDQVRFTDLAGKQRDLSDVPALAFSEIMRDVDLFVGVCSVGNDPQWHDQGTARDGGTDYWQRYSFGDLSAQAETRKDVMSRLLPRLAIGGKCSLEGKFLRVTGGLRTYKIHLGSGNILMEPNDQYLCIVPDRSAGKGSAEKVFLPFEGDQMFSIILSKAFLLARDREIKDETILRQITRTS